MRWRLIVCCLGVVAVGAGCAPKVRPSQPVPLTRMPAHPLAFGKYPIKGDKGRVCRTRVLGAEYRGSSTHHDSSMLPAVSTHLVGATAFWLPGAEGAPCRSVRTAVPAGPARKIAVLVNAASQVPAGPMSCGLDDGTRVWLYLQPAHAQSVQKVVLSPVGCLTITADDLWPRWLPAAAMRTLAPYAPPGWSAYLHNGVPT